jgi:hypothetical protein
MVDSKTSPPRLQSLSPEKDGVDPDLKEAIVDLYLAIKIRSTEEVSEYFIFYTFSSWIQ